MTSNGKGSSRRGTSKKEMKRFQDNYDTIFAKNSIENPKEVESETNQECCAPVKCSGKIAWIRCTQFAGNHPYCDLHAKLEKDFRKKDSYTLWQAIEDFKK